MKRISRLIIVLLIITTTTLYTAAAFGGTEYEYKSPEEINKYILKLAKTNKKFTEIQTLAETPGKRDLIILKIGDKDAGKPAVLVAANMEGNYPLASEAAVRLAQKLLAEWQNYTDDRNWYIIPLGNPDGYANFFEKPLMVNYRNAKSFNDDKDNAFDEDGPEDLNGDGFITKMRQKHPKGSWVESFQYPTLMRRADNYKGEEGVYRMYSEGIDNDGDGRINEDGSGGVNPGHNYPHDFKHYTDTDGLWAANEAESRAILEFAFDHPEIAMVIVLGRTNTLKSLPEEKKDAGSAGGKYQVPKRYARRLGIDPEEKLPLKQITELFRDLWDNPSLSEDRVKRFLGGGALINPDKKDVPYWKKISDDYNKFTKKIAMDAERLETPVFSRGSFEEWAYYQYGVPTFCMDFWTAPVIKDEPEKDLSVSLKNIKEMSAEEFLKLEDTTIDSLISVYDIMKQIDQQNLMAELESGKITPENLAEMLDESFKTGKEVKINKTEAALYRHNPDLFLQWKPYDHPTLGEVEIGGMVPYAELLPPTDKVDELIEKQLPFITKLPEYLPSLLIEEFKVEEISDEVWKVKVWIKNEGFLPYPTHQGYRSKRPIPAVVEINIGKNVEILEGKKRVPLKILDGSDGTKELNWLIKSKPGDKVELKLISQSAGKDAKTIILKEED